MEGCAFAPFKVVAYLSWEVERCGAQVNCSKAASYRQIRVVVLRLEIVDVVGDQGVFELRQDLEKVVDVGVRQVLEHVLADKEVCRCHLAKIALVMDKLHVVLLIEPGIVLNHD